MIRIKRKVLIMRIFNVIFIIFSLLCIPLSQCEDANAAPTYNNIFNPHTELRPQIECRPQIIITNSSALSVKIGDITLQCIQKIQETITRDNFNLLKNNLTNLLWNYRYHLAGGTVVGAYTIANLILLIDYYYHLDSAGLWAHWKQELSFEDLCNIPQKDLTQKLLLAINKHYYNKEKPTDFAHPLTTFIYNIDKQIKICKRYISIASTIKKLHAMPLFLVNDAKINKVTKLLERTFFIKHLFLSWLAEYNIGNNQGN